MELVTRNYQQLEATRDIGKYIDGYNLYQRMKNRTKVPVEKLIVNKVLEKMQIYLMMDLIAKLLLVARKNVILVVYNQLSKIAYFVATTEKTLVKGLVRLFRNNI